jgi:hypothetical protein
VQTTQENLYWETFLEGDAFTYTEIIRALSL